MNSAWPNLHWHLFDYYLNPAGSYFGTKVGARPEHLAFTYDNATIYLINHFNTIKTEGNSSRLVHIDLIDSTGQTLYQHRLKVQTEPNHSQQTNMKKRLNLRDYVLNETIGDAY